MARYMAAKKTESKQRAHKKDEAAKKKAAKEAEKKGKRRQKDVKAAAKKSQAVAEGKMERLAEKSKRDLEKLEKMRRSIVAKKNAAKGQRSAPKLAPATGKRNAPQPAASRRASSVVDDIVASIPGIKTKTASDKKRAAPRKTDPASIPKRARDTKEENARRKKTETALARMIAKSPEEETSEEDVVDIRPNTRARRCNK